MNGFMSARAVVALAELPAGFVLDILTTMDADRWERLSQLFHAASEREPAERQKFLAGACAGDEELRREIESGVRLLKEQASAKCRPAGERREEPVAGETHSDQQCENARFRVPVFEI